MKAFTSLATDENGNADYGTVQRSLDDFVYGREPVRSFATCNRRKIN